ncbi:MAG: 2-oxoglutarate dehydrogenase E1 component [Pseudomonadota bacterium]
MSKRLDELLQTSHLAGGNATYLEELYDDYLVDPNGVPEQWQKVFRGLGGSNDLRHLPVLDRFATLGRQNVKAAGTFSVSDDLIEKQAGVLRLINAYRLRGHQRANLDPLELSPRPDVPDLSLATHGLNDQDLDTVFNTGTLANEHQMPLRDLVALLESVYCTSVGAEYMHITDTAQRRWLQERLERTAGRPNFSSEEKISILEHLTSAEGLEKYLHTKYVGQKRFSLEGGESLIPLLHGMIQRVGSQGVEEVVMGMAHRGRLNVLVNILGKSPALLFEEFEGKNESDDPFHVGDVKYHLGYSSELETPGGIVHITLGFNPSHLEIIDPVVAGSARARQTRRGDFAHKEVMPVLIHGDAAVAGQGVVMELFNMSQARGFQVGGTMHVVINNQIGFTLSNPLDARSTLYCTEVAKMVQAPIFHVNGDDPEAVMFCMQIASDYRMAFKKDVVIDLVCYRRLGHNEADEPAATQPVMYKKIRQLETTRALYARSLANQGILDETGDEKIKADYRDALDAGHPVAEIIDGPFANPFTINWQPHLDGVLTEQVDTTVSNERLQQLGEQLLTLPEGFVLHSRVQRIMDDRRKMLAGDLPVDWGFAENLAYASLIEEGYGLRLVGQDSGRGTFFHRHAVLHNQNDGELHTPLESFARGPESADEAHQIVTIIDSLLSEEAVLGFEYGFASSDPRTLCIWEAQFGDFVNGAQVVIDQFISSGEAKWGRLSGLVMFLPHGYEGQGPEHSSARLERFMQLCAFDNIQVCVPTTPAQMFHMLRRQMIRATRKPLVVMTPKSLLRNKASTSAFARLGDGQFQTVIPDRVVKQHEQVERILLCSGKVYYDIVSERQKREDSLMPVIRVEQLYPFPRVLLGRLLADYPNAKEVVWCQEEPMNQGAWYQIKHHLQATIKDHQTLLYCGRSVSPSPAAGRLRKHVQEQEALVAEALTPGGGIELAVE